MVALYGRGGGLELSAEPLFHQSTQYHMVALYGRGGGLEISTTSRHSTHSFHMVGWKACEERGGA